MSRGVISLASTSRLPGHASPSHLSITPHTEDTRSTRLRRRNLGTSRECKDLLASRFEPLPASPSESTCLRRLVLLGISPLNLQEMSSLPLQYTDLDGNGPFSSFQPFSRADDEAPVTKRRRV